jgi:hypothetical protein
MSHQDRRLPLPADYQYPTHGVDCDCPPCRNKHLVWDPILAELRPALDKWRADCDRLMFNSLTTQTAYGWGV